MEGKGGGIKGKGGRGGKGEGEEEGKGRGRWQGVAAPPPSQISGSAPELRPSKLLFLSLRPA